MALSEEQQEWLAAQSADLVARMTGLVSRHRELMADTASVQPRVPVSRAASADPPVSLLLTHWITLCGRTASSSCGTARLALFDPGTLLMAGRSAGTLLGAPRLTSIVPRILAGPGMSSQQHARIGHGMGTASAPGHWHRSTGQVKSLLSRCHLAQ